jgi:prepilin-type N-terminal cleavage/methylation domain-containing protein
MTKVIKKPRGTYQGDCGAVRGVKVSARPRVEYRRSPLAAAWGFSLLELVVAMAVILIIAAVAIPNLLGTIRKYQLDSSARNIQSILMRARYEAVRTNQRVPTILVTGTPVVYGADLNRDGTLQATEPNLPISSLVQVVSTTPTPPSLSSMGSNYSSAAVPTSFAVNFGSLGTVVQQSGGTWIEANAVYVIFLQHKASGDWAAVTVTPGSRFRVWFWNGAAWTS